MLISQQFEHKFRSSNFEFYILKLLSNLKVNSNKYGKDYSNLFRCWNKSIIPKMRILKVMRPHQRRIRWITCRECGEGSIWRFKCASNSQIFGSKELENTSQNHNVFCNFCYSNISVHVPICNHVWNIIQL